MDVNACTDATLDATWSLDRVLMLGVFENTRVDTFQVASVLLPGILGTVLLAFCCGILTLGFLCFGCESVKATDASVVDEVVSVR